MALIRKCGSPELADLVERCVKRMKEGCVFDSVYIQSLVELIEDYKITCVLQERYRSDEKKYSATQQKREFLWRRILVNLEKADSMLSAHEPRATETLLDLHKIKGRA